jgi:hypothetical protein
MNREGGRGGADQNQWTGICSKTDCLTYTNAALVQQTKKENLGTRGAGAATTKSRVAL